MMAHIQLQWCVIWITWILGWILGMISGIAYIYCWCSGTIILLGFAYISRNNAESDGTLLLESIDNVSERLSYLESQANTVESEASEDESDITSTLVQPPSYNSIEEGLGPPCYTSLSNENTSHNK